MCTNDMTADQTSERTIACTWLASLVRRPRCISVTIGASLLAFGPAAFVQADDLTPHTVQEDVDPDGDDQEQTSPDPPQIWIGINDMLPWKLNKRHSLDLALQIATSNIEKSRCNDEQDGGSDIGLNRISVNDIRFMPLPSFGLWYTPLPGPGPGLTSGSNRR